MGAACRARAGAGALSAGGLTDGPGRGSVEQLRAVVVGAGPWGGACERAGIAETVRGIGLVGPGAVVEVRNDVRNPWMVAVPFRPANSRQRSNDMSDS